MPRLAIGLGSSLGDRAGALTLAVRSLSVAPGLRLRRVSAFVRTPPLAGGAARNWFLNAVALFEHDPTVSLEHVLVRCVDLEERAGRRRGRHWGDRPLDLDLLLAEGVVSDDPRLVLPHPAIRSRPFVLGPLLEVWPDAVDPRDGTRLSTLPVPAGPAPAVVGRLAPIPRLR
ncbi:MAG: 2-amino-4-hydroxy-6-hydroxymethyldihydropteridine diphosphokinase [Myxococcales bacterium]|nr:2-amino-4-hydroxy-6-hydroxymethyldihydropteridine diphosphokinase [Myxococcales bacterium]